MRAPAGPGAPGTATWWRIGAVVGAVLAMAAARVAIAPGCGRSSRPPIALADTRPIEPRLSAPTFDRHRPYRVAIGAPAREVLPLRAVEALEQQHDLAGLAAAHVLRGDLARATAALDATPASPSRDSDRAAVALASRDPVRALQLADVAIAAAPDLAPAHWNRALALRALDLPLAAAAELDSVAARGEPGWADEARVRAEELRAPLAARDRAFAAYRTAAAALIAASGPPLDDAIARRHPGLSRTTLFDALAVAASADQARALRPLAAELDRIAGNDAASRAIVTIAGRDFAARRRFHAPYRAMIAGKLDGAQRTALIADLERTGGAVADLLVDVLVQAPPTDDTVARLRRALAPGDAWRAIQLADLEAQTRAAAGDLFAAEHIRLGAAAACRDPAWTTSCGSIDLGLGDLYLRMRRLDEADAHLRAARAAFAQSGAPELEDRTLRFMANLERLRDRDAVANAYLDEMRLRAPDRCDTVRFVDVTRAVNAFNAGDLATARARLPDRRLCGRPPSTLLLTYAVEIARIGDARDRARADALIELARKAPGSVAVAADLGEGRLRIDTDPVAGAAQIRAGLARIAALGAEPGTAGELRAWGVAALIGDTARRGEWPGALALFVDELGRPAPAGCVVAVSLDDDRSTAIVRGRDRIPRGSYQPGRSIASIDAGSVVPPSLAAGLDGCDAVAVIARPPLHGHSELLPAALPWSFVSEPGAGRAWPGTPSRRRVIVSGARPPATLGLPALAAVTAADATLVTAGSATPARVRAELADAGYVEIHAHGIVDASDAAFLALSPDPDGRFALTADEVRTGVLAGAPVVVLAACRSATPALYQGFRWSLPDAFLVAGARAVVASSTAIPDDQGATLFAELRARVDRGEAIAHAVAALRVGRLAIGQAWAAGLMVFE